jgi:L-aminopeptidase/D-esterase-like protein
MRSLEAWPDEALNPAFAGVIQCVDEAVLNAMVANEAMTGRDGHHVPALPHAPVEAWCRALRAGPPPA